MKKIVLSLIALCVVVFGREVILTTEEMRGLTDDSIVANAKAKRQTFIKQCLNGNMKSCEKANGWIDYEQFQEARDFTYSSSNYYEEKRNFHYITSEIGNLNCKDYMKVIKKGCQLGSGDLCAKLGDEYHPIARGGSSIYGRDCSLRNQDETYKYYRKACELGESKGCRKYRELEHLIYEIDTRERDKTHKSDITIRRK